MYVHTKEELSPTFLFLRMQMSYSQNIDGQLDDNLSAFIDSLAIKKETA